MNANQIDVKDWHPLCENFIFWSH